MHYSEVYLDRVQSQTELENLIAFCMKDKEKIKFKDFAEITEKVSSEMFLCVIYSAFLYKIDLLIDEETNSFL